MLTETKWGGVYCFKPVVPTAFSAFESHNKPHNKPSQRDPPSSVKVSLCLYPISGFPGNWKLSSAPNRHLASLGVYQQCLSFPECCPSLPTDIPRPGNSICEPQCCVEMEDYCGNLKKNSGKIMGGCCQSTGRRTWQGTEKRERRKDKDWEGGGQEWCSKINFTQCGYSWPQFKQVLIWNYFSTQV